MCKLSGMKPDYCGRELLALRPVYRGISLKRRSPPLQEHHRALNIVSLQGPGGALFLMGEVTLY